MTPTPEDIALANKIEERAWCPAHLDNVEAARLIAAHTAPLRELAEIGRLRIKQEDSRMSPALWLEVNQQIRNAIGEYTTRAKHPTP